MSRTAVERASDLDRQYFDEHPGETSYYRQAVPGELPDWENTEALADAVDGVVMTEVRQVRPGFRLRRFAWIATGRQGAPPPRGSQ